MEWTPEDARKRMNAALMGITMDERRDDGWARGEERFRHWARNEVEADMNAALAHIATLTAQAQAWEQERVGLVTRITETDPTHLDRDDTRLCWWCGVFLDDVVAMTPVQMDGWTRFEIDIADYAKKPHNDGCFWMECRAAVRPTAGQE